ncbi:MAG: hypothetical protein QXW97_04685 [Candidatus Pacearchaeota archaeon]
MKNWVIIIGVLILILSSFFIGYYANSNNNALNDLREKLNQSLRTNANLNAYVVSLESQIETLKNYSRSVSSGTVYFWKNDGMQVINVKVPMDSISAKKSVLDVIKLNTDNFNEKNYQISSIKVQNKIWTANFSCNKNITETSLCSGLVKIYENNRTFELIPL